MKIKAYGVCLYKKEFNHTKILLCKSTLSKEKWGFLKGVQENFELKEETAIREFKEESSIIISISNLEKYFEQINDDKDIGIFLVDYYKLPMIDQYFFQDKLYKKYLSWENSDVEFFSIDSLPKIKKKQKHLTKEIIAYLKE